MIIKENEGYFETKLSSISNDILQKGIELAINDSGYKIPTEKIISDGSWHLDFVLFGDLLCRIVVNLEEDFFSFGVCYTEGDRVPINLYENLEDAYNSDEIEEYMLSQKEGLEGLAYDLFKSLPEEELPSDLMIDNYDRLSEIKKDYMAYSLILFMIGIFFYKLKNEGDYLEMGFGMLLSSKDNDITYISESFKEQHEQNYIAYLSELDKQKILEDADEDISFEDNKESL